MGCCCLRRWYIRQFRPRFLPVHQFTARMNRTKARLADIDTKIGAQAADEDRGIHVRSVMSRLAELARHLQSQLNDADWSTKREIIRALVQRIEIGPMKIAVVLRLPT